MHRDSKEERKFWVKCSIVKVLVIILVLYDFFVMKRRCQERLANTNVVNSFSCFGEESQYVYLLKSLFFNSHRDSSVADQSIKYKLNIFMDLGMKIVVLINLRLDKFYLFKNKRRFPTL